MGFVFNLFTNSSGYDIGNPAVLGCLCEAFLRGYTTLPASIPVPCNKQPVFGPMLNFDRAIEPSEKLPFPVM